MPVQRECVRLNPHFVVGDANIEETAVIKTILRPLSNGLFSSKKIRIFGPLGVAIPLREMVVGLGDYYLYTNQDKQQLVVPDWLPNPTSTFFYTPYVDQDFDSTQFEIIWQFNRFIHGKQIDGIDDVLANKILTVNNKLPMPTTTFNPESRRYVYQGWTRAHLVEFFSEYCASKVTAAVLDGNLGPSVGEWMNARPPDAMTEDDWQRLAWEIGSLENICTDEAFTDVGASLVEHSGPGMPAIIQGMGPAATARPRMKQRNRKLKMGKYVVVPPDAASILGPCEQSQIVLDRRRKAVRHARLLRRRARVVRKARTRVNRPVSAPKIPAEPRIDVNFSDDLIIFDV
ncbi:uncharacterized protein GIQ15_05568 [Arthroderma uncinatum]|uniref:uncharacterized protein n=1 Tax=Arthroderma uncinatum TaxID=74035 RepID=UPI00144AE63D|nr:uncharacterized protein GIQ15_05568 [Arthroderma uncinatum]KAF3480221.1 hypothetical protein GIQ15_05568 [Arthroderma uncinatum]